MTRTKWTAAVLMAVLGGIAFGLPAAADSVTVTLNAATMKGAGPEVGTVTLADGPYGLMVTPDLHGLEPGPHGLHVHANPACGPSTAGGTTTPAGAAGGHYDPAGSGRHAGPYGDGHLGDLPNLVVEADGTATIPVVAPRLHLADVRGRGLMIHAGPDRYTGRAPGGARGYCGVIR